MSFACMECGHKFRTIAAAEKASFGDKGCPKCGGSDIDLKAESTPIKPSTRTSDPAVRTEPKEVAS